jgi:hypothetical protein
MFVANGKNGKDGDKGDPGQDGQDGLDGISPTITVEPIEGGHKVTITDKNGSQSFKVFDGGGDAENDRALHLDSDEICEFYAIKKDGEPYAASGYGCSSFIPCENCVSMKITLM